MTRPSEDVLSELENAYANAKAYADSFNEAAKAQAEKHDIDPVVLKQYVRARHQDKLKEFEKRQKDMEQLTLNIGWDAASKPDEIAVWNRDETEDDAA